MSTPSPLTAAPSTGDNRFLPLRVREASNAAKPPLACVIEFPNGIILRLSGHVDDGLLSHLLALGEHVPDYRPF
ncbi:MAG: hypothetical protein ONB46_26480 [candidate division KSB1 bacterium]|nr:hypothetical protein [candidate division KSB1 bacterium]MDZ7369480.1 hypothetical protein [candidate division KSB1 bacterium]MDZ7407590.1 hypothetical protein [candidate division KSB1 bacterium]